MSFDPDKSRAALRAVIKDKDTYGLTQASWAEAAGLSAGTLGNFINAKSQKPGRGTKSLTGEAYIRLAEKAGVDVRYLMGMDVAAAPDVIEGLSSQEKAVLERVVARLSDAADKRQEILNRIAGLLDLALASPQAASPQFPQAGDSQSPNARPES